MLYLAAFQVKRIGAVVEDQYESLGPGPNRNLVEVVAALNMLPVFVSEEARRLVQAGVDNLQTTQQFCWNIFITNVNPSATAAYVTRNGYLCLSECRL